MRTPTSMNWGFCPYWASLINKYDKKDLYEERKNTWDNEYKS
jgi:hypothetical protein